MSCIHRPQKGWFAVVSEGFRPCHPAASPVGYCGLKIIASLVQHNELENHHFSWEKITINGDVP